MQAAVQHRALGLGVGCDLAQTVSQARFHLVRAILERDERLVALPLERRAQARQPLLDAPGCRLRQRVQPLGENALRLAREPLDRQVELAGEPSRRFLACGLDRAVERQRRRLGVARRLAGDGSLQLLDVATLDVAECELDPLRRIVALALDDLLQVALAAAQPVGDVVQRVASLGGVLLELGVRLLRDLVRRVA